MPEHCERCTALQLTDNIMATVSLLDEQTHMRKAGETDEGYAKRIIGAASAIYRESIFAATALLTELEGD